MKKTNSKKLRYGALGAGITAIVVIIVMLLNTALYALSEKYNLYADMTKEKVYGVSEETINFLTKLKEDIPETEVSIKFCADADKLEANEYLRYVFRTAKTLDERFDFISVEHLDIVGDPASFAEYVTNAGSEIVSTSVIVTCNGQFRIKGIRTFFTFTEDDQANPYAYDGEYTFISTILQMAYAGQVAYFTEGHGEEAGSSSLYSLLERSGFECRTINLKTEDFEDVANGGVVIINNPRYDFSASDETVNEIKKLDKFMDDMGNMMVFTDPQWVGDLDNLNEYLSEWGISLHTGKIRDYAHTISVDGYTLVANYSENGDGSTLHKSLRSLDSTPTVIFEDASPIEIIWDAGSRDTRHVSNVFTSFDDASLFDLGSDTVRESGKYDIMTISQEEYVIESQRFYSSVLVSSSAHFADEKYLNGNSYGNSDILYTVMRVFGQSNTPSDIDFKVFDDNSIVLEKSTSTVYTVLFCAIIPAAVLVIGGAIVFRRRRK